MKLILVVSAAHGVLGTPNGVQNLQALRSASASGIKPSLDPVSDKKFFGTDYPDDLRPGLWHFKRYNWDHPYPIVQEDKQYDADYVKDENNDNGEWNAQHRYDVLRSQIIRQKAKVDDYKRRIEAMGGDIDKLEAQEAQLEKDAKSAEDKANAAKSKSDAANGKASGVEGEEENAAKMTKEEMEQLKRCEEELRKVEEELKRLLNDSGNSVTDAEKAELELKKAAMEAELKQMSEAELEAKLAEEKAEYEKAKKEYEKLLADSEDTEKALDKAAEKLRKFRAKEDKGGGVYPVAFHSNANRFSPLAVAVLAAGCLSSMLA